MKSANSEYQLRIVLVGRAHVAKLIERLGEEIEQCLEPRDILDHARDLKNEFVHAIGEWGL